MDQKAKSLKDSNSHSEYERVKKEWKEHYEQMRLLKKQHRTAQKTQQINRALHQMENALHRLGLEDLPEFPFGQSQETIETEHLSSPEETINSKAKESLDILATDMGIMDKATLDTHAQNRSLDESKNENKSAYSQKTIGKKA